VPAEVERVTFKGFGSLVLVGDARGRANDWPVLFLRGGGKTRQAWGRTAEVVGD